MLDNDIEVYTTFYNDYDFKHHTYNENIDHFFEAPFYIGFFINSKNIPEFEGNVYKFLSKLRYRQFANLLREGVIEDIVVEPDDTLVIMLTFDTLTDKKAVDRIVNAFKEAVESDNRDM